MTEPTQEQPQVTATVSPALPPKSRWGAIPHHLGRARTSTVVLSLLFLAIGVLWLNVRPDPPDAATNVVPVVGQTVVPTPTSAVPEPEPEPTTDPAPTGSTEPEPTSAAPTTTSPGSTASTEPGTPLPTTTSEAPATVPSPTAAPTG